MNDEKFYINQHESMKFIYMFNKIIYKNKEKNEYTENKNEELEQDDRGSIVDLLKSDFHLPKNFLFICFNESSFKSDEKCFLFHLKSSFCSQDV